MEGGQEEDEHSWHQRNVENRAGSYPRPQPPWQFAAPVTTQKHAAFAKDLHPAAAWSASASDAARHGCGDGSGTPRVSVCPQITTLPFVKSL